MRRTSRSLDDRPGSLPTIRAEGDMITFHLDVQGLNESARLVIRCDAEGNAWASIARGLDAPSPSN